MTEMTRHDAGMLCWADLETSDPSAAKGFYGELFGWSFKDEPMTEGGVYSMAQVRGKSVAALAKMEPERAKQGILPHWNTYISVTDVEATTKKVAPAGGKVLEAPFDAMGEGRMAIVQDPTGAILYLWQPLKHQGATLMNETGALCWAELMTHDTKAAGDFYAKVLGWKPETMDMGPMGQYTVFGVGKAQATGMMELPKEASMAPSAWSIYVAVENCDATVTKATKMRGKVLVPARDAKDVGRFAVLQDPQGAVICVLQPSPRGK
jgi:predicted enzyme related to lactoylglutathione lyase